MIKLIGIFFVTLTLSFSTGNKCPSYPKQYAMLETFKNDEVNLLLAAFIPMYEQTGEINPSSLLQTESLKHHASRISNMNDELPGAINFGLAIYDTSCADEALNKLLNVILNKTVLNHITDFKLFCMMTSENQYDLTNMVNVLLPSGLTTMSILKTGVKDDQYVNKNYNYRMSYLQFSADEQRANLIVSLLRGLKIHYVTILYDNTNNGKLGRTLLVQKMKDDKICIAQIYEIPGTKIKMEKFANELRFDKRMTVFIIWNHIENKTVQFMTSLDQYKIVDKVWIISSFIEPKQFSNNLIKSNRIVFIKLLQSTTSYKDTGFVSKYLNRSFKNQWLDLYTDTNKNKSLQVLNLNTQKEVIENDEIMYKTTEKMWQFISRQRTLLKNEIYSDSRSASETTYRVIYFSLRFIGSFKLTTEMMINNSALVPFEKVNYKFQKVCDSQCEPGFEPYYFNQLIQCCWECRKCPAGYTKPYQGQSTCSKCPGETSSNYNRTICRQFQYIYPLPQTTEILLVCVFATLSTILCLFTMIVFIKYKDTPVVRASDGIKTLVQLASHVLLSVMLYTFIIMPTQMVCTLQPILIGFLMTITASVTFIKTKKLMLIFQARTRLSHKSIVITKVVEISTVVFLISIQIIISFCFFLFIPHYHKQDKNYEEIKNYMTCNTQSPLTIQLIYVKILSLLCLYQAFKARKLPENFNETKHIGVAVLVSEIFLLSFILKPESNAITDVVLLFCSNFFLTIIMYSYRVYVMLLHPEKNNTKVFREKIMKHCKLEVRSDVRSQTFTTEMKSEISYPSQSVSRI